MSIRTELISTSITDHVVCGDDRPQLKIEAIGLTRAKYSIVGAMETSYHQETINFQEGDHLQHGFNGVTEEALIAICIDRLKHGQRHGPEIARAILRLQEGLMWLQRQTAERAKFEKEERIRQRREIRGVSSD